MGSLRGDPGPPAVEARELTFWYGEGQRALDAVELRADPGRVVALLGPNGSGKTTLLRLLAGRLRPDGGRLRVLGAGPPLPSPVLRRAAYAGAEPVHRESLSGRENARFFARARGMRKEAARRTADGLLERLGLAEMADEPVSAYSRGMKRKLLLAECLVHRPDLLLLDEPFGGLDPPAADALTDELRRLSADGAAVVLATHAVGRVPELADRIVFLHRGRVVADEAPGALLCRLRERRRAELRVRLPERSPHPALAAPFRVEAEDRDGTGRVRLEVSWPADEADVTDLLRILAASGAALRELRVPEPDLSGAFRVLTGDDLDGPASGGSP